MGESDSLLTASTRRPSYDSLERADSTDSMDSPGPEQARLGSRVRLLLALAMALALVFAAVSTTPSQRTDALSRLNALNFKESLTHAGEVAQTPPPSRSGILKTYRPTTAPTEEKSESLPNKKSSSKPGERAGKPFLPSMFSLLFLFLTFPSPLSFPHSCRHFRPPRSRDWKHPPTIPECHPLHLPANKGPNGGEG